MRTTYVIVDPLATTASVKEAAQMAAEAGYGICVEPSLVQAAQASFRGGSVSTWAGLPWGKHHSLVKASEARLAVQCGATEVAFVPDVATVGESATLMSELITVREAVPHPARLAVVVETTMLAPDVVVRAAREAAKCGFDAVVTGTRSSDPAGVQALHADPTVLQSGMDIHVVCSAEDAESFSAQSFWIVEEN